MLLGINSKSLWTLLKGWTSFFQKIYSRRYSFIWCFWWWWLRTLTCQSIISHRCSVGLLTGDCEGHRVWFPSFSYSSNHLLTPPFYGGGIICLQYTKTFLAAFPRSVATQPCPWALQAVPSSSWLGFYTDKNWSVREEDVKSLVYLKWSSNSIWKRH